MNLDTSENIYDMALISKVKEQTNPKKLKKIIKNLRNLENHNFKKFSSLKAKMLEEEEKETEFKIVAPTTEFKLYFENFKKSNSKLFVNSDIDLGGENTSPAIDDNEKKLKQIDSSDFSEDE